MIGETSLSPSETLDRNPLNASQSASPQSSRNDSSARGRSASASSSVSARCESAPNRNDVIRPRFLNPENRNAGGGNRELKEKNLVGEVEGGQADEGAVARDLVDDEVGVALLEGAAEAGE